MTTTRAGKAKVSADRAATLERQGRWAQAKTAWRKAMSDFRASPEVKSNENAKYCQNRSERCGIMAITHDDDNY